MIVTVSKGQCLRLYIDKKIPAYLEIRQLFENIIQKEKHSFLRAVLFDLRFQYVPFYFKLNMLRFLL